MRLETYSGEKPYIFISYAHKDADAVLPIIAAMQKQGFRIWFDQGIEAGTEWPEFIAEHLDQSESVIVFMSNAAAESKNCRREINYAIDINREPLVVYLEEVKLSSGLKLQLNTLQAMFKYHAKTDEDFIVELCRAKMLQSCREEVVEAPAPTPVAEPIPQLVPETPAEPTPIPTPTPAPAPTPIPTEVSVTEAPVVPKPTQAPAPTVEPIPVPIPPKGFNTDAPKKKKRTLSKKAIIALCCVAVFVIGFAVIAIGYLSTLEEEPKTTTLVMDLEEGTSCEVQLNYRKSDNVVTKIEMTIRYDISEYEYNASELDDQLYELRQELREEVKDMLFASTFAGTEPNTIYTLYRFEYLDQNHYAQQLVDDFFETKDYSPHYDEGDYRMYYVTMYSALLEEGFELKK